MKTSPYRKLSIILMISLVIMYGVMFLNVDDASHIYLSLNRLYMSFLMVSPMAVLMVNMMGNMYQDKKMNLVITVGGLLFFVASFYCLRTQAFISDVQYMRGMIPHHSSAIMTSKNAAIKDQEVRILADSIIKGQEEEIRRMKRLLDKVKGH